MKIYKLFFFLFVSFLLNSCKHEEPVKNADLVFTLGFDPTQLRLNSLGEPAVIPVGHGALTPDMNEMSLHYIELSPNGLTALGKGEIVYHAEEITSGGSTAIDFENAIKAGNNDEFFRLNIKDIKPGRYEYIRASVSYQNYHVKYNINEIPGIGDLLQQEGTIASFVGFNTYIKNVVPRTQSLTVNSNMPQGYWVFETNLQPPYSGYNKLYFGQAPEGATTVVNPLFGSSPIPAGSCVVTGQLAEPLVIKGDETEDVTIRLNFSVNNSFEWIDDNGNGQLDFYGTVGTPHEKVVDMGLRGLIPVIVK